MASLLKIQRNTGRHTLDAFSCSPKRVAKAKVDSLLATQSQKLLVRLVFELRVAKVRDYRLHQ
jgi:hypothetical protein